MADSTLNAIRSKVRLVTHSPSTAQITDAQIDQYINTFMLYDFPEQLRLFSMRTTLQFYTQPYVDTYETNTTNPLDPLYNFRNKYTAIHQPVYLAGVPGFLTQDRAYFYSVWPQTHTIYDTTLRGNGTAGPYIGSVAAGSPTPILQGSVTLTTTDLLGNSLILKDYAQAGTPQVGFLGIPGQDPLSILPYGFINYITGQFNATFSANVPAANPIYGESIPYQPAKPIAILYYDNQFVIRPVPDMTYVISVEADIRPTELLASIQIPDEEQWWQYVALGASIKIFQDRFDMDSVNLIWPEFQRQEDMVGRKSLAQYANERAKTLYTQPKTFGAGWFMTNWPY
jgi:hypothetical protein